jgi:hypothetical protein
VCWYLEHRKAYVDKAVSSLGHAGLCGVSSSGVAGQFCSEGTV